MTAARGILVFHHVKFSSRETGYEPARGIRDCYIHNDEIGRDARR